MAKRFRVSDTFRLDKRVDLENPYGRPEKYPSDTRCPECGLLFHEGVWKWKAPDAGHAGQTKLCPACLQIRGGHAGGVVELGGSFTVSHRQELLNRIRNVGKNTLGERPLERIISIKEGKSRIVVSATTEHLIARIGKAIQRDFGGTLDLKYAPEDKFATARWHRDV
ncbi:MAG: ATPase [Acidobacteriia bacterium]|nr:ATPase [Terriglobia bacterium]